jgi:SAM-dependent methyltransferase
MRVLERVLLSLSAAPQQGDCARGEPEAPRDGALDLLTRVYPDFDRLVRSKRVLDYGCGVGHQSIALVEKFGCSVVGIDTNSKTLKKAAENARARDISSERLQFAEAIQADFRNSFDVVISQNSFEHFADPVGILDDMGRLLNDSGIILLTFGPPWLAPYGSHMQFFCKVPWVNVLFPEEVVMNVRNRFRGDGAKQYQDVESGLNRMTVRKFESIVSSCNLKIRSCNYECVKGLDGLARLPLLREFFINHISAVLCRS